MEKQQAVVVSETLSDGSKVHNVVAYDGNKRITLYALNKARAESLAEMMNDGATGFDIDVLAPVSRDADLE